MLRRHPIAWIVVAQLLGTSLWFSANAAADDLMRLWALNAADIGRLTNAVQIGFIAGTLVFAFSGVADRFAASRIFAVCASVGALFNAAFAWWAPDLDSAWWLRLGVGLSMAGVYPVGMKLIVSWSPQKASQSLGLLVGMLILGSALPHGLRALGASWPWTAVVSASSLLALIGAAAIAHIGDGPHLRRQAGAPGPKLGALAAFGVARFRASALGYFGHMWELYAFWTLSPLLVGAVLARADLASPTLVSAGAFAVMGIGALGSIGGGWWAQRIGGARVAFVALAGSGLMCLVFPWIASAWPVALAGLALLVWGVLVVADSAQFSAMSMQACPPQWVGSAITLQNSLGFLITTAAIAWTTSAWPSWGPEVAWLLLPGPLFGLWGMRRLLRREA
jgi:MFS family permease